MSRNLLDSEREREREREREKRERLRETVISRTVQHVCHSLLQLVRLSLVNEVCVSV